MSCKVRGVSRRHTFLRTAKNALVASLFNGACGEVFQAEVEQLNIDRDLSPPSFETNTTYFRPRGEEAYLLPTDTPLPPERTDVLLSAAESAEPCNQRMPSLLLHSEDHCLLNHGSGTSFCRSPTRPKQFHQAENPKNLPSSSSNAGELPSDDGIGALAVTAQKQHWHADNVSKSTGAPRLARPRKFADLLLTLSYRKPPRRSSVGRRPRRRSLDCSYPLNNSPPQKSSSPNRNELSSPRPRRPSDLFSLLNCHRADPPCRSPRQLKMSPLKRHASHCRPRKLSDLFQLSPSSSSRYHHFPLHPDQTEVTATRPNAIRSRRFSDSCLDLPPSYDQFAPPSFDSLLASGRLSPPAVYNDDHVLLQQQAGGSFMQSVANWFTSCIPFSKEEEDSS